MLEIKNIATEIKDAFDVLISRLNIVTEKKKSMKVRYVINHFPNRQGRKNKWGKKVQNI